MIWISVVKQYRTWKVSFGVIACASVLGVAGSASAQRLLGLDVSAHQSDITTTEWATLKRATNQQVGGVLGDGRDFVIIRSSRGGTTGYDHRQGAYPSGNSSAFTASERYDDPYFVQNISRATAAGLYAGAYHFARLDVIVGTANSNGTTVTVANTGADEADHFMQMAGPWMRPGYMPPMYDLESGQTQRTAQEVAQFSLDFSNRIYQVMGIRPSIYSNGNYNGILANGTVAQRDELAKPPAYTPSVISPAYPTLVIARWPNQTNPESIDVQNGHPKDSFTPIYGPWDDYGTTHPWNFWQYSSTMKLNGNNLKASNTDVDVSQGDAEWMKDNLIPAVWMSDNSGNWSTLTNWNSGQPVVAPLGPPTVPSCGTCTTGTGQLTPIGTQTLPSPRLPGEAGTGPAVTSGVNDTVILERPNANITVTLSSGSSNIRKLYMRETLNITGGTLNINYDPNYFSDTVTYPNALRSGSISAQFSGAVTLSGTGNLSVNTLQIDANQIFTLAGSTGTLTFRQLNLLSLAKIAITGDVNIDPLSNNTATISGGSGSVDLSGSTRSFTIGNGSSDVDLDVVSPIVNGGLTKNGAGTMRLSGANTFAGSVTVNAGVLRSNNANGFSISSAISVNGGTLDMNGITDTVASLAGNGGAITQGAAGLTLAATSGNTAFAGTITGTGTLTKNGSSTQILNGNNSLGPVALSAGTLLFNGVNTTGAINVSGGTLGGTGSVSGAVTVNDTGHLAPGTSIESLDVGALTLNAGSALDIELGAPGTGDQVNVTNLLTINGGSINLINSGGLDAGIYSLLHYGTLSGSVGNLGNPIGGPTNFTFTLVDTGSAINLVVGIPGDFNHDAVVDSADYIAWKTTDGSPAGYDLWQSNFGRAAGGFGEGLGDSARVPEPTTAVIALWGLLTVASTRRSRDR